MKALITTLLTISLAMVLTACGDKGKKSTPINTSGVGRGATGTTTGITGPNANQQVKSVHPGTIQTSQVALDNFATAFFPNVEQAIGLINMQGTGVSFSGQVQTNGNTPVTGSMIISIVDSYVTQQGFEVLDIGLELIRGTTDGYNADLEFAYIDQGQVLTYVRLVGNYNQQTFNGTISFQNTVDQTGGEPKYGTLGHFTIDRCRLFLCQ